MINTNRIVPVTATDLISLYGVVLLQDSNNSGIEALETDEIGVFEVTDNSGIFLASEPVKSLTFGDGVTASTVYFVPAYDFVSVEGADDEVDADGRTLYKAVLSSGSVTVTKIGF